MSCRKNIIFGLTILNFICDNNAKTILGSVSTTASQREWGQFITTYCFHGEALLNYTLNTTGSTPPKLYLFLNEDWHDALLTTSDCQHKLSKSRAVYELKGTNGSITISHYKQPRLWNILYADSYTCDVDRPLFPGESPNYIAYKIQLFNPDALGNPTEHFGDDETGLLRFYQMLILAYFVIGCIFVPRLHETLKKGGPMQLVLILLTISTGLQALGAFTMMIHLQWYSTDGIGSPFLELLAEFVDVLSQFAMLYMLLSLSLGWTLGTSYRFSHLQIITKKPAARVVGVMGVIQAVLFLWEQYADREHRMYHAQRSYGGLALVFLRILLAALFAWNLQSTVASERSALRREFYKSFTKCCMLWFLCYPVIVVVSWVLYEYLRYKMITMAVVLCQCFAVAMLYKLFLSRSLYWEISALSSTLPLRIDKNFGMKAYS
ncbi:integral membrane protein GPR180-like [Mizuhopecten yessoensis]|uniref:Integral membrane protein GPR180 n=1 Tax=Mizuhopecten yessoensis TaxID=6573 RepID=A0A210R1E7_MIZYE|nr:integral membrane protein GPR180-like [Mizuhopecten yessoensis]OWF54822.1 Integral membrane protein GPR180 [Mizuhopecten yessoensis]